MYRHFFFVLFLCIETSCGHLVGGAVNQVNPAESEGVRYYLPRTEFLLEETISGSKIVLTVKTRQVPDLRYPYHVYLSQGLFSTDIFDVVLSDNGLISSVSGNSTEQTIESVQALAEMAVDIMGPAAGIPIAATPESEKQYFASNNPRLHLASVRPVQVVSAPTPCEQKVINLTVSFTPANLDFLDQALGSLIDGGMTRRSDFEINWKNIGTKIKSGEASYAERSAFINQRVANYNQIKNLAACTKVISRNSSKINSDFSGQFEGVDENLAAQFFGAKLLFEEKKNSLALITTQLRLDLENTFFVLTVDDLVAELSLLGKGKAAQQIDNFFRLRKLSLDEFKNSINQWHAAKIGITNEEEKEKPDLDQLRNFFNQLKELDPITRLRNDVSGITGGQCGIRAVTYKDMDDVTLKEKLESLQTNLMNLEMAFRLNEAHIRCIIKEAENSANNLKDNSEEKVTVGGVLNDLLLQIEFLLQPAEGADSAEKRATPLISTKHVSFESSHKYEMALNKTFRVRNRLEDFSWTQLVFKHNVSVMEKKKAQIIEAKSRIPRFKSLVKQRNVIRGFLETSVPKNKAKIRTGLQEELAGIYKELDSLVTIPTIQLEPPKRRRTPRVLYLTKMSKVPSDIEGGRTGDVYILVRPRGYVEGLE